MQLSERFFVETELEFAADTRGESVATVEYVTATWLLNDNSASVVGEFLSATPKLDSK